MTIHFWTGFTLQVRRLSLLTFELVSSLLQLLLFLHAGLQRLSAGSHANLWYSGILGKNAFVRQPNFFVFLLLPLRLFVLCFICSDKPCN